MKEQDTRAACVGADAAAPAGDALMQRERLASIGLLAAGVAHEINNPIGYVFSNFATLQEYLNRLFEILAAYERAEPALAGTTHADVLVGLRQRLELDYLKQDIPALMAESREGIARVRKIVQDLKDFSRVDNDQEWVSTNLHDALESTLNLVINEIKYKAEVVRSYAELPEVECLPGEINQVFLNILVNAADAIQRPGGRIVIATGRAGDKVWVAIEDNGAGIPVDVQGRIFDPFFTTKPPGKGTGLGLSLSYGIVKKHSGSIEVRSAAGGGARFTVTLPIRQSRAAAERSDERR